MPVNFLSEEQRTNYGNYSVELTKETLARYFHLDDFDRLNISEKRGEHNRLGFAILLCTVRFIGKFPEISKVPDIIIVFLAQQLHTENINNAIDLYNSGKQRRQHIDEIISIYGYTEFTDSRVAFSLTRWLYSLCWTGTNRPGVLFERCTGWLLSHKVLLPGYSLIERYIARLRSRVENRLWHTLSSCIDETQTRCLLELLSVPPGSRYSLLDQLRTAPTKVNSSSLRQAISRLHSIRNLGITLPAITPVSDTRIAALARYAATAKITVLQRLPEKRKLATLVAFACCMEATAQDDVLELLEALLRDLFNGAVQADKKNRQRTIKDLDRAAEILAKACKMLLDDKLSNADVRDSIYNLIPESVLENAVNNITSLIRPVNNVYFNELDTKFRTVRLFLPEFLSKIHFEGNASAEALINALYWIENNLKKKKTDNDAPREIINKSWQQHVIRNDGSIDFHAYTFCTLKELQITLKKRDIYVSPSWRYADPRTGLIAGNEWEALRPIICRSLGLSLMPAATLTAIEVELITAYRDVLNRLPENPAVRFSDTDELILSPLDAMEETPSLIELRQCVTDMLPRVDLSELILEIDALTQFSRAFTHISEQNSRVADLNISICAMLMAEACNTGPEPFIRNDIAALKRDRLAWTDSNYIRDETIRDANAILVSAQTDISLSGLWGGGEVASADGMRFVVPVRTVHAGPNPKYFGKGRGVTWYNLISDQYSGLNDIVVPGTLRDSLVILAVVLEQQTEQMPFQIMTDTGAYSDIIFGLFRLLGYRFCPRLADTGGARFWRIDPKADYGPFNPISSHRLNFEKKVVPHWDDILRLIVSLKLGRLNILSIMKTLQIGDRPTSLAQAIAEIGRADKTIHMLTYLDDETKRRKTLQQLNRGEGRHAVARNVFHGKRGELRQAYREGQEDQLGSLGLVLNMIVLWNTIYMDAAVQQLRREGYPVHDEDVKRLSPLLCGHINMQGRYTFTVPETVSRGELRPFNEDI
ncbi:transposase (plasmid) [Xenorhabdus nematophila ATCC 19061]|uniref:Transposase n=1 Tax=Xenorhabdus nematophila (strain ATCC 19061 / DSM 3370 / CCUG 14189 / LMG 1036 / NCIMB 9965 / AN6) TaxID=406817 RepID=D3VLZ9_XENNA|nr:Tn3 family transposase [Xenorhabdus nematophila]CBJ92951.1 transposase [Xenorhabdus nematophila ATCC 19061]CEK25567.1 transposase [Xenorhabdus nematophila AN6/1]